MSGITPGGPAVQTEAQTHANALMALARMTLDFTAPPPAVRDHPGKPCLDNPDLWFPDPETLNQVELTAQNADAADRCLDCPVFLECRRWAIRHAPNQFGVWGGMTPRNRKDERARLKRARNERNAA